MAATFYERNATVLHVLVVKPERFMQNGAGAIFGK
jgi:hypothetical protein